jgi:hypothetical protein
MMGFLFSPAARCAFSQSAPAAGGQEVDMPAKNKRRSVMDALRELMDKLNEMGSLLKPKELQPVPVRNPDRLSRRR